MPRLLRPALVILAAAAATSACSADGGSETVKFGTFPDAPPPLVPAPASAPPEREAAVVPDRAAEKKFTVPAAPLALADIRPSPAYVDPGSGERIGKASEALRTEEGQSPPGGARETLYIADGSGGDWLGGYPATAHVYNTFSGPKYWISGPGTFNEEGYEILLNLGSRMYWDCRLSRHDSVIAGYSRGAYNVLEAYRWATVWGCAPPIKAALFIDPVDTLIWGYSHVVPDNAPTRIFRKAWWYNIWATVFMNGAVYGGQQYIREEGVTHAGLGSAEWVANDLEDYGNWFLGTNAFRR